MFTVTAWCNGKNGYGFKISQHDRDIYFSKEIKTINLLLRNQDNKISVNINKSSLWENCRELIHLGIRDWLNQNGYIPWSKGSPPKFNIVKISETNFKLVLKNDK